MLHFRPQELIHEADEADLNDSGKKKSNSIKIAINEITINLQELQGKSYKKRKSLKIKHQQLNMR